VTVSRRRILPTINHGLLFFQTGDDLDVRRGLIGFVGAASLEAATGQWTRSAGTPNARNAINPPHNDLVY